MYWKGVLVGGLVGYFYGGGLGALFGAWCGRDIERAIRARRAEGQRDSSARQRQGARAQAQAAARKETTPYDLLGVQRSASNEALRRRYRELAKQNHPDILRAQGRSEAEIAAANARMSRINAAWATIRKERGI